MPEKSDVLLLLSYLPPLSHFVPFCLTPPPPLKSDIIYARSLSMITLSFILKLWLGMKAGKESSALLVQPGTFSFPEPQLKTKRYIIPQTAKVHILCNFTSFFSIRLEVSKVMT